LLIACCQLDPFRLIERSCCTAPTSLAAIFLNDLKWSRFFSPVLCRTAVHRRACIFVDICKPSRRFCCAAAQRAAADSGEERRDGRRRRLAAIRFSVGGARMRSTYRRIAGSPLTLPMPSTLRSSAKSRSVFLLREPRGRPAGLPLCPGWNVMAAPGSVTIDASGY